MQDSAWETGAEAEEAAERKPARTSETIPVPAPNSMMLHPLLYPNSLSLSFWTMAGCSSDVAIDSDDSNSTADPSKSAMATERRTSHALNPIPLSHNF